MKTKIKPHGDEVTDFYDKEFPKLDSNHTCLAVISLDSAFNKDGNYYPQVLLKECKIIEKKIIRHINDNLRVIFISLMSLMKNKLELGLFLKSWDSVSKKTLFLKWEICTKKNVLHF